MINFSMYSFYNIELTTYILPPFGVIIQKILLIFANFLGFLGIFCEFFPKFHFFII
ncbi:Hypothetical protein MALK_1250 [Metamycoplasma alkalescens 14918]|uniref:Uncharacterized protein n=1 Tax=Metamycoplasma alkalescens 14918 TaxID=1188234 RepID=N9UAU4_9BACT|nr:Hypothetical protein MALK_1250 [Metamycoplasma alkalescens 14918]